MPNNCLCISEYTMQSILYTWTVKEVFKGGLYMLDRRSSFCSFDFRGENIHRLWRLSSVVPRFPKPPSRRARNRLGTMARKKNKTNMKKIKGKNRKRHADVWCVNSNFIYFRIIKAQLTFSSLFLKYTFFFEALYILTGQSTFPENFFFQSYEWIWHVLINSITFVLIPILIVVDPSIK